jgi:hypothetical protein
VALYHEDSKSTKRTKPFVQDFFVRFVFFVPS